MQVSIVLAQVRRAQDSLQVLMEDGLDAAQGQLAAEAQEALRRAEVRVVAIVDAQASGLGQHLVQVPVAR